MDIREEDVSRYQTLVKSHYGKEIDRKKARDELTKLCRLLVVITRSIPEKDFKELNKKEK